MLPTVGPQLHCRCVIHMHRQYIYLLYVPIEYIDSAHGLLSPPPIQCSSIASIIAL